MDKKLYIDAKNIAYRAIFACKADGSDKHPYVAWLRQISCWVTKFNPNSVHVFWDCPKRDVWRKRIYEEYKENRSSGQYDESIVTYINEIESIARDMLPNIGVRLYRRDGQEADDLLYAACKVAPRSSEIVVVSSDKDMQQLPWHMPNVKCFSPDANDYMKECDIDPALIKALMGDKSDNIDGYDQIGPKRSNNLMINQQMLVEHLIKHDDLIFKRNLVLVDVTMNPAVVNNVVYVLKTMNDVVKYDSKEVMNCIIKYSITGLLQDIQRMLTPFKNIGVDDGKGQEQCS